MLYVQHNLLAQNANRQLKATTDKNAKTTEKLSSGYRVNRAADDAAGLSISEKMRRQVRGLHQTVDNISEGVGYVQTAEGALNEVQDMLQRINELAVKAANGTNTNEDRLAIDQEIQQLKAEMNRIFSETEFNERKIWYPGDKKLLGYKPVEAVGYKEIYESMEVTNKNYAVLPGGNMYGDGSFYINADLQDGISVSWVGYNGASYETDKIGWDQLAAQKYIFEMSTLFDKTKYPELFDGDNPVFTHKIGFSPAETATIEDMVYCLNGRSLSSDADIFMKGSWENTAGNNNNFQIISETLYYPPAYASMKNTGDAGNGHNFDASDDGFLEATVTGNTNLTTHPQYSDVTAARSDSTGWEFSFDMVGIGKVKAASTGISFWTNDVTPEHENLWWEWCIHTDQYGVETERHKTTITRSANGTLAGVMSALTGDETTSPPGILSKGNDGCNDGTSAAIQIHFNLTAESEYHYTGYNGKPMNETAVGSFSLYIPISSSESEEEVWERIKNALNDFSILDFSRENNDRVYFGSPYPNYKSINAPIYGGICNFYVQAGTEGGQHIDIKYEALSTIALGIGNTNARTIESASRAINEVKGDRKSVV